MSGLFYHVFGVPECFIMLNVFFVCFVDVVCVFGSVVCVCVSLFVPGTLYCVCLLCVISKLFPLVIHQFLPPGTIDCSLLSRDMPLCFVLLLFVCVVLCLCSLCLCV